MFIDIHVHTRQVPGAMRWGKPAYATPAQLIEFQDRLFFGTDICAPDIPTPLVDLLLELRNTGKISENVFSKAARENALKLLGL